jgi:hypothetical protein
VCEDTRVPAIRDLRTLIADMEPALHPDPIAFCVASHLPRIPLDRVIATMREAEGITVVLSESDARAAGLQPVFLAAWITLNVHSDLEAVGLTAAVSTALAEAGISCNVIAGVHHDHLFVPHSQGSHALAVLRTLVSSG